MTRGRCLVQFDVETLEVALVHLAVLLDRSLELLGRDVVESLARLIDARLHLRQLHRVGHRLLQRVEDGLGRGGRSPDTATLTSITSG